MGISGYAPSVPKLVADFVTNDVDFCQAQLESIVMFSDVLLSDALEMVITACRCSEYLLNGSGV